MWRRKRRCPRSTCEIPPEEHELLDWVHRLRSTPEDLDLTRAALTAVIPRVEDDSPRR